MNTSNLVSERAIDYERLTRLHDGSRTMIVYVLTVFLDDVLPDFEPLEQGVQQQQWPTVAGMAHQLVPWLGMVGLTSLETELRALEQQAKHQPLAGIVAESWRQFKAGLEQAMPLLRDELARLTGDNPH